MMIKNQTTLKKYQSKLKSLFLLIIFFLLSFSIPQQSFAQNKGETEFSKNWIEEKLNKISDKNEKLKVYGDLINKMIRKNHKNLTPNLKGYMGLANQLKEYDLMASKSRFLIQQYIMKGENDKGLKLCDSMLSLKKQFKKKNSEAHILLKRGGIYFSELNYKKAIKDYETSAKLFLESKDSIFSADAYFFEGQAYSNSGDFVKAIDKYEVASQFYEKLKDYNYMFEVAKEINLLYKRNGLRAIANKKLIELIKKAGKYKAYSVLEFLFLSKAEEFIKKTKYDLARQYLDSSKKYSVHIKDIMRLNIRNLQYNQILLRLNLDESKINEATVNYKTIIELEKSFKDRRVLSTLNVDKAKYLSKKGKHKEAIKLLTEYKKYAESNSVNNMSLLTAEKQLSKINEERGNINEALKYSKNYITLKDSIHKTSLTNAFAFHQTRFETAQKEKEILEQKNEIQQLESAKLLAENRRITLLMIVVVIILLAFGISWRGSLKRKQLKKEISKNKIELENYTRQLLRKGKEQESLITQLNELKETAEETAVINTIQDLLTTKILTKDDWYSFKEKFTKVYPVFFKNIKDKGYKLTKSEERLVALEKLDLDNTEIANMLGVSVDSVFISRYRLRKKINAPKEVPLIEFFE